MSDRDPNSRRDILKGKETGKPFWKKGQSFLRKHTEATERERLATSAASVSEQRDSSKKTASDEQAASLAKLEGRVEDVQPYSVSRLALDEFDRDGKYKDFLDDTKKHQNQLGEDGLESIGNFETKPGNSD